MMHFIPNDHDDDVANLFDGVGMGGMNSWKTFVKPKEIQEKEFKKNSSLKLLSRFVDSFIG